MRLDSNRFAKREAKLLRVRCVELARREKAIKIAYNKLEFWLPISLVSKIDLGEDGYTRITIPDWLLNAKVGDAVFAKCAKQGVAKQSILRTLEKDMQKPKKLY